MQSLRFALMGLVILVLLGSFLFLGPILAIMIPLALGFNWLNLRSWLAAVVPAVGKLRPLVLGIGSFLVIGISWSILANVTGITKANSTPTPTAIVLVSLSTPVPTATPVPPTSTRAPSTPTPHPTNTPAPTATPRLTATVTAVVKSAPSGIGLTRQAIQSVYEKPGGDFTFQSGAPVNGQPQVIGSSSNGFAILQIIGPSDNVQQVSMLVIVPKDRKDVALENAIYLIGFVKVVAPDWKDGVQWVTDNLDDAIQEGEVTTSHGKLRVTLQAVKELGMIGLTIKGTPG